MIIRATILLALVMGAGANVCDDPCCCQYTNQTYSKTGTPSFFIQAGFDGNGYACAVSCSYYLYSGDPTMGVGEYTKIQWTDDAQSKIVFNNFNSDGTVTAIRNINQSTPNLTSRELASSTAVVRVDVTTTGATSILVTFTQVPFSTPSPPITVPPTTTLAPYNGDLSGNPAAISNDLLIMVDGGKSLNGNSVFLEMRELAASIVDKIATGITFGNASDVGVAKTRLALNSMTVINTGALLQAWHSDAATVSSQIRNLPQVQTLATNYTTALNPLTQSDSPFSIKNSLPMSFQDSRLNAQRILLVVSNAVPVDLSTLPSVPFIDNDIHPIYLAYKLDAISYNSVTNGLKGTPWSFYTASDNSAATVNDFVNNFLLSGNIVCASIIKDDLNNPITPTNVPASLSIPASYSLVTDPTSSWVPSPQKNRYCNWQTQTIKFKGLTTGSNTTCFTVYYELENGKDRVRFIPTNDDWNASGLDLVTLSGLDVSGTIIRTKGNIVVQFETNESDVRGGFNLQYKAC